MDELFFKSSAAAFEYACKSLDNSLADERPVLAIVLAVKGRKCMLKFANDVDASVPTGSISELLAGADLATVNPAAALIDSVPNLKRGDLVMYVAAREAVAAGKGGLAGVVVARVKPIYVVSRQAWQAFPNEH